MFCLALLHDSMATEEVVGVDSMPVYIHLVL